VPPRFLKQRHCRGIKSDDEEPSCSTILDWRSPKGAFVAIVAALDPERYACVLSLRMELILDRFCFASAIGEMRKTDGHVKSRRFFGLRRVSTLWMFLGHVWWVNRYVPEPLIRTHLRENVCWSARRRSRSIIVLDSRRFYLTICRFRILLGLSLIRYRNASLKETYSDGEKGINLSGQLRSYLVVLNCWHIINDSGGQKWDISLEAIIGAIKLIVAAHLLDASITCTSSILPSDIALMDDPLSAVDSH